MTDDIVYAIFKEIAILEGKRNPDGTWTSTDPQDIARILARAFAVVRKASSPRAEQG